MINIILDIDHLYSHASMSDDRLALLDVLHTHTCAVGTTKFCAMQVALGG